MSVLTNAKHEHFAQEVAKGVSATKAYVSAGYSKAGAHTSATRMLRNAAICARIKELAAAMADGVVALEIRKRSARVQALQANLNRMLELIAARALAYADDPAGATGMLVKDYRGKDANQEVWKFDGALIAQINDTLKQAAIEEGQWTEKRENKDSVGINVIMQRLNAGRDRAAAAKRAREAK